MALIGKIRGMRLRDGKSISEISTLTSLSHNTIKRPTRGCLCDLKHHEQRHATAVEGHGPQARGAG